MSAIKVKSLINSWETSRFELYNTRICDLPIRIAGSPIEPFIKKLYGELEHKKLKFRPQFYLSDSWGCPNQVPVMGIPFYLSDHRLARIEAEQTGEIEDARMIMMLMRHETGHAINYAYRLWEYPGWSDIFGTFTKRYHDSFNPNPYSKQFVKHLITFHYGRNYAQKHPDDDFAETFAVWLTPRSVWRIKYRYWPAMNKLKYVDELMKQIRKKNPVCRGGELLNPVEEMTILVADHYGEKGKHLREAAMGYVDDTLKDIFPDLKSRNMVDADELIHNHRRELKERTIRWSGLDEDEVDSILNKLENRASFLGLKLKLSERSEKLKELTALCTSFALNFIYTGRLNG